MKDKTHIGNLPAYSRRLPRLDCALSGKDVASALVSLGIGMSERIAACMDADTDTSSFFTVDPVELDKAMASRGLSISERMNLKTELRARGLLGGPRTLLSNSGPFARIGG